RSQDRDVPRPPDSEAKIRGLSRSGARLRRVGERLAGCGVTFRGFAERRTGLCRMASSEISPMFPAGLPLLLVPFALYNILVFLVPNFSWNHEIWHVHMMSGGDWVLTLGDAIVAGSVVILLIEMLRAARRASRRTIVDHVLSMVLFVAMLVEFM